jgi:hypothetical protein
MADVEGMEMETSRRETILGGAVAAALAGVSESVAHAARSSAEFDPTKGPTNVWNRRFKRAIQINLNEQDPEYFDAKVFSDWMRDLRAEVAYISVTDICMFYPSKIPDAPLSKFLNGRDVFGESCRAAKDNNVRIMARCSPNVQHADLIDKHPDWFRRHQDGSVVKSSFGGMEGDPSRDPELAEICTFGSFFDQQFPAIIKELLARYPIDGVYTNGWPSVNIPVCYCPNCQKVGDPHSEAYRRAYQARTEQLWSMYAELVASKRPDMIFSGNLGGRFKGGEMDLTSLMRRASIFTADNQGRGGIGDNAWDVSQQCRLGNALMKGRTMINVTGSYQITGSGTWRNVTGNPDQVRQRLAQTLASGGALWYHWLGHHQGFVEDRRWQHVGREFFAWQAANDKHFHNTDTIATVALLVSQRSNRLYKAPVGTDSTDALEGMYEILTDARIPFDVIIDTDLTPEYLSRYSVLILPNVALMSDRDVTAVKNWVAKGGSLLSTFETANFDENGGARPDFGFGDLYGMKKTGDRIGWAVAGNLRRGGGAGPMHLQRLEPAARRHPVTTFLSETNWIQGANNRVPLTADGPLYLSNIPPYPQGAPEEIYPRTPKTDEPVAVFREKGRSRLAYFSMDLDGAFKRTNANDLQDIIASAVHWLVADRSPLTVEGAGLVETFGWVTEPGYAVHLVNYTYPNFKSGPQRHVVTVGPQKVRLVAKDAKPVKRARLLRAGQDLPFTQNGRVIEFTIPDLGQYEVAALET